MNRILLSILCLLVNLATTELQAQEVPVSFVKDKIEFFKNNARGPYKSINWFCKDGSVREARDPCPNNKEDMRQHASYRDDTKELASKYHLFFGEILSNTVRTDFWDEANNQSRLKQYQLNRYLESIDDGWIQQKSQFYRGAIQIEDEQQWGEEFYQKFLPNDARVSSKYYLLRQSLKDIPHDGDTNLAQLMRSQSKNIADDFSGFMDVRIKIHGNPTKEDIATVKKFKTDNKSKLKQPVQDEIDKLLSTMEQFYAPADVKKLQAQVNGLSSKAQLKSRLKEYLENFNEQANPEIVVPELADILCVIRTSVLLDTSGNDRLILLDLSNSLEDILLKRSQEWQPEDPQGLMEKIRHLSIAATGTGLIELWEWERSKSELELHLGQSSLNLKQFNRFLTMAQGVVSWSTGTVKATYQDVVDRYTSFEPKSYGFIDDRIRSSVALPLGEAVSQLGALIAKESNLENKVMGISASTNIRGLNPGYAYGRLVVIEGSPEGVAIDPTKIYIFEKPPSDLKPIAGIMTVSEGNLVSHVQLLARNLGIPNAALTDENLKSLKKYNGDMVFYAVSEKGNVVLKEEKDMSQIEKDLFSKKERNTSKIAVPVDKIRLDVSKILDMRSVDASDSGKLCGPKAANLGQLKKMFPDNVVEGLVIPFGIFRSHMDQPMPGKGKSYWEYLIESFAAADQKREQNVTESQIETYMLERLSVLKTAIEAMPLQASFEAELSRQFTKVFGSNIGSVPVFLRSDTNMEDLPDFTGAGLNLTLFNIVAKDKILEGIKRVWASPYTERSFKWRQRYLNNPENVFPSILIIPSVDVEYSGVMITKGINSGQDEDLTVAFSRGAGGAVDGQVAETRLITAQDNLLLAPAREPQYMRLPSSGGTVKYYTTFEEQILNKKNIEDLKSIANQIRTTLPAATSGEFDGAWDVELGFAQDKLWLFQIRPFVENKRAKSSEYLNSITPEIDYKKEIPLRSN